MMPISYATRLRALVVVAVREAPVHPGHDFLAEPGDLRLALGQREDCGIRLALANSTFARSAISSVLSQPACHSSSALTARISAGLLT